VAFDYKRCTHDINLIRSYDAVAIKESFDRFVNSFDPGSHLLSADWHAGLTKILKHNARGFKDGFNRISKPRRVSVRFAST